MDDSKRQKIEELARMLVEAEARFINQGMLNTAGASSDERTRMATNYYLAKAELAEIKSEMNALIGGTGF